MVPRGSDWEFLLASTVILRIHVSTEMKPNSIATQECGIYFTIVEPEMIGAHTVRSRFAICLVEFVDHSCLLWVAKSPVKLHVVPMMHARPLTVPAGSALLLYMFPIMHRLMFLYLVPCCSKILYVRVHFCVLWDKSVRTLSYEFTTKFSQQLYLLVGLCVI